MIRVYRSSSWRISSRRLTLWFFRCRLSVVSLVMQQVVATKFALVKSMIRCFVVSVAKTKTNLSQNEKRMKESRMFRQFVEELIKDGKAKEFLVEHGFVKPNGGLTKRYGG